MNKLIGTTMAGLLATILGTALPTTSLAAGPVPPAGQGPIAPDRTGVIDDVDLVNNVILVDDRGYRLNADTVFHGTRNGRAALRKGAQIGLRFQTGPQGELVATDIWIQ